MYVKEDKKEKRKSKIKDVTGAMGWSFSIVFLHIFKAVPVCFKSPLVAKEEKSIPSCDSISMSKKRQEKWGDGEEEPLLKAVPLASHILKLYSISMSEKRQGNMKITSSNHHNWFYHLLTAVIMLSKRNVFVFRTCLVISSYLWGNFHL